jgi:hypothetical protein
MQPTVVLDDEGTLELRDAHFSVRLSLR